MQAGCGVVIIVEMKSFSKVKLIRDIPDEELKAGDVVVVVDEVSQNNEIEDGYVIEVFNLLGESIRVTAVPKSAIAELTSQDLPQARKAVVA